jgi:hypothetical protein
MKTFTFTGSAADTAWGATAPRAKMNAYRAKFSMVTSFLLFQFFLGILAQNTSRQQSTRSACLFYDVLCDYESERLGL